MKKHLNKIAKDTNKFLKIKIYLCGASRGQSTDGLEAAKLSEEPILVVVSGA